MGNGHRVLPLDARGALRFTTERGWGAFEVVWRKQLATIQVRARLHFPDLKKVRAAAEPERQETRAQVRAPLLREVLGGNDIGELSGATNL